MTNFSYVFVLILCGYSIRSNLSQDSEEYKFFPNIDDFRQSSSGYDENYFPRPFDRIEQGQNVNTDIGFQQVPTQGQVQGDVYSQSLPQDQFATPSGSGGFERLTNTKVIRETPPAEVRVTYFSTQPEKLTQDVKTFVVKLRNSPQSGRHVSENLSPPEYNQLQIVPQEGQQYYTLQDYTLPTQQQFSPKQDSTIQNSQILQPNAKQISYQKQTPNNTGHSYERYTVAENKQSFQRPNEAQYIPLQAQPETIRTSSNHIPVQPNVANHQQIEKNAQNASLNYLVTPYLGSDYQSTGLRFLNTNQHQSSDNLYVNQTSKFAQRIPEEPGTPPSNPTKKAFYFNPFAADLYTTKKPCEICCNVDEVEPCGSCCNATALLNSQTLKTAVG